eukprot:TRINITY_DN40475_c0_g1_i1.p1 TRINITY_DN40475_c0_g1~~TRINITY_DN40475_c0_g1_i1.p1  ORF type:complete len:569 (-),score=82.54 TRINITY_DN40475_c0_g1_i1:216-1922(-)
MVSKRVIAAYAAPGAGFGAVMITTGMYVPRYYIDNVGIPFASIGLFLTIVSMFDAVTDPLAGIASDRSTSKFGRRRVLVAVGSTLLAAAFVLLFTPPLSLPLPAVVAYALTMLLAVTLFGTIARMPWLAWGAELTSDYDAKTTLVSVREACYVVGAGSAAVLPPVLGLVIKDQGGQLACASAIWALFCACAGICAFVVVPDKPPACADSIEDGGKLVSTPSTTAVGTFLWRIMGNRPAVILVICSVCYTLAVNVNGILFPFFVPYVVEREATSFVLGGYIAMGAMGVPVWTWLAARFEKRPVLAAAMAWQTLMMTIIFCSVGSGDLLLFTACIWSAGVAFGSIPALMFSIISDVLDYEQLRSNGFRDEGQFIGLLDIIRKLTSGVASSLCFALIDWSGYEANIIPQTSSVRLVIRLCYGLCPAVLGWTAVLCMLFYYPIDRKKHAEIIAELEKRRQTEASHKEVLDDAAEGDVKLCGQKGHSHSTHANDLPDRDPASKNEVSADPAAPHKQQAASTLDEDPAHCVASAGCDVKGDSHDCNEDVSNNTVDVPAAAAATAKDVCAKLIHL